MFRYECWVGFGDLGGSWAELTGCGHKPADRGAAGRDLWVWLGPRGMARMPWGWAALWPSEVSDPSSELQGRVGPRHLGHGEGAAGPISIS